MSVLWLVLCALPSASARAASATTTVHGSWSVECRDQDRHCVASQKVATDPEGQKVVLGVIVEPGSAETGPLLTFRLTAKAYLPAGAGMKIDHHEPLRAPISSCDQAVCEVRARLTPQLSSQLSEGKLLIVAFFVDPKKQVSLPVSLQGFDAAFAKVTGGKPAPGR